MTNAKIAFVSDAPLERVDAEIFDNALKAALGLPWKTTREELRKDFYFINLTDSKSAAIGRYSLKSKSFSPAGLEDQARLRNALSDLPNLRVVVALGEPAFAALSDDKTSITKIRGSVLPQGERFLVPTLAPWQVKTAKDYMERRVFAADLGKALALAEGRRLPLEKHYEIDPDFDRSVEFLRSLREAPAYSFDIETPRGAILCIAFADSATHAVSINVGDIRWSNSQLKQLWAELKLTLEAPKPRKITQNGNFDTFWLTFWHGIHPPLDTLDDTMILHHIAQPDLKKSLAMLTSLYTSEKFYKDDGGNASLAGNLHEYMLYNAKDAAVTFEVWEALKSWVKNGIGHTYGMTMSTLPDLQAMQSAGFAVDQDQYSKMRVENRARQAETLIELRKEVEPWIEQVTGKLQTSFTSRTMEVERLESLLAHNNDLVRQQRISARAAAKDFKVRKGSSPILDSSSIPNFAPSKEIGQDAPSLAAQFPLLKASPELKQARKLATKARDDLAKFIDDPVNVASPWMHDLFYRFYGVKAFINRKTKEPTLDDDALASMARGTTSRPPIEAAKIVRRLRGIEQEHDTFLTWTTTGDGRYRYEYNPRGTKFGRFSGNQLFFRYGTNPQNMPPRVRTILVADPPDSDFWYVLLTNDKRQIEWVVVANLTGDPNMLSALAGDTHSKTAALMSGATEEFIKWEKSLLGKETNAARLAEIRGTSGRADDFSRLAVLPTSMTLRQMGKKANHALNYGEGEMVYSLSNEISIPESRIQINRYHTAYPGVRRWHGEIAFQLQTARSTGSIPMLLNCFGRVIPFHGDVKNPQYLKAAFSAIPQSTAVDSLNPAMKRIRLEIPTVQLRMQTHDDLSWQARISRSRSLKDEAARIAAEATLIAGWMSPTMSYVAGPFTVGNDLKMGVNMGDQGGDNPKGMAELKDFETETIYKRLLELQP